jgi:hypothetical protein
MYLRRFINISMTQCETGFGLQKREKSQKGEMMLVLAGYHAALAEALGDHSLNCSVKSGHGVHGSNT